MNKKLFVTVTAVCGLFIAGTIAVGRHEEAKPVKEFHAPKPKFKYDMYEERFKGGYLAAEYADELARQQGLTGKTIPSKTTLSADDLQYELDKANDKIEELELRLSELESD